MNDTCPKCGEELAQWSYEGSNVFKCGTVAWLNNKVEQHDKCRVRELKAENERLRAANMKMRCALKSISEKKEFEPGYASHLSVIRATEVFAEKVLAEAEKASQP